MTDKNKILVRDDSLLRKEKSWRRARIGVVILGAVWLLMLISYIISERCLVLEQMGLSFILMGWMLFWLLLFDWLNMRLRHIESIKYYRDKIEQSEVKNTD